MISKEQVEAYRRRMEEFNRWENEHPPVDRSPASILADLGLVLSWIAPDERLRDPDPEKLGIQRMRAILARVGAK